MITKTTAYDLGKYGFRLIDKEGITYDIVSVWSDCLFLNSEGESENAKFTEIGTDYHVLCRPYSQLTSKIEHEGVKVIPIVEIGKMIGFNDLERFEVDDQVCYGWNERFCDDAQGYHFTYDEKLQTFGTYYDFKEERDSPIYTHGGQKELNKLYSYHFKPSGLDESNVKYLND